MMRSMTRAFGAAVLSGLLCTSAFAAPQAPLAAGKPAGVKQAALQGPGLLWIGAAVIIAVTVAVVASDDGDSGPSTTATGTAP
jgi:hypothetical protein